MADLKLKELDPIKDPDQVANAILVNLDTFIWAPESNPIVLSDSLLTAIADHSLHFIKEFIVEAFKGMTYILAIALIEVIRAEAADTTFITNYNSIFMLVGIISLLGAQIWARATIEAKEDRDKNATKEMQHAWLQQLQSELAQEHQNASLAVVQNERLNAALKARFIEQKSETVLNFGQKTGAALLVATALCMVVELSQNGNNWSVLNNTLAVAYTIWSYSVLLKSRINSRYNKQIVRHFMGQRPQVDTTDYKEMAELDTQTTAIAALSDGNTTLEIAHDQNTETSLDTTQQKSNS
jgi:hypothetical protein